MRPTFMLLKATFFIMYLNIFIQMRWVRIASWAGLITSTVLHVIYSIWAFAVATPSTGLYYVKYGRTLSIPTAAFGLVIDVWILAIPVGALWGLNMTVGKKWKVVAIFTGGAM
jgi:hypothetical protein